MKQALNCLLIGVLVIASCRNASAFYSNGRWNPTAPDGATGTLGTSTTVTWSLIPDGTAIPGRSPSSLVFFLDNLFGSGPGGTDFTQRPWFRFFDDSFGRWAELSGLAFVYEPADDGTSLRGLEGSLGVRGDIRIGGTFLDGNLGTLASTSFLNDADITIDTGDLTYYGNSAPSGAYQNIHNTLMHEIGHAFGLGHIESSSAVLLMEPFTNAAINGPQLDDIRGIQSLYGDANEKGAGNNALANATPLGIISQGTNILHGQHASTGTTILMGETNFLSISNSNDFDYFSFEVAVASAIDIVVTPLGPDYNERINSSDAFTTTTSASLSNLSLELFAGDSAISLAASTSNPIGQPETIHDFALLSPGEYIFRVSGSSPLTQMYQFLLSAEALVVRQPGDFDNDDDVDGHDFLMWQRGASPAPHSSGDLADWQAHYGVMSALADVENVPESGSFTQLLLLSIATGLRWPHCRHIAKTPWDGSPRALVHF